VVPEGSQSNSLIKVFSLLLKKYLNTSFKLSEFELEDIATILFVFWGLKVVYKNMLQFGRLDIQKVLRFLPQQYIYLRDKL
jgi:hypothetical protein